jgi:hypothetical protein
MPNSSKLAIALLGLFLSSILWLYWGGGTGAESKGNQLATRSESGAVTANSNGSATGGEIGVVEPVLRSSALSTPLQISSNKLDPDEFVAETLKTPDRSILPSKIPTLSDAQVDQLAAAYLKIAKPTQKSGILWALGFSQNDRAFDTLQYATTSEYSGAALSTADNVAQLRVVPLIGVLSRTSDRAWQLLVNLARPDAWERIDVWSEDYLTEQYKSEARSLAQVRSSLQGGVITALSASGRPEFMAWASSLIDGSVEPVAFNQRHADSVAYGVFQAAFIEEHGFNDFYDGVMYSARQGTSAYSQWSRTEDGKRWTAWWQDQVTQAVNRDAANLEK